MMDPAPFRHPVLAPVYVQTPEQLEVLRAAWAEAQQGLRADSQTVVILPEGVGFSPAGPPAPEPDHKINFREFL